MTKASPACWSNFRWVNAEVHGFCDTPNYRAFNADSVEGNFCLHINKVSFRLLNWLGKKDTHPFFSDTGKAGSHCGLTVPFLFQNPFAVFFIYLLQSWLTQKSFCSLSPVTFPTNCCSQQASSAFTHQPRVPQISQPTLKALASLLHHSSYPLQSFPHTMVLIHSCPSCPVNGNFGLVSSGHKTIPVPGCKNSSELCSCIEIPPTLNPGQQQRQTFLSKAMLSIFPGYLYSVSLPFVFFLNFKIDNHFHLSSTVISITSDKRNGKDAN